MQAVGRRNWPLQDPALEHVERAREQGWLTLPEAIRKITSAPAERFGLKRRGRLEQGWHADLTLFDPANVGVRVFADAAVLDIEARFRAALDGPAIERLAVEQGVYPSTGRAMAKPAAVGVAKKSLLVT